MDGDAGDADGLVRDTAEGGTGDVEDAEGNDDWDIIVQATATRDAKEPSVSDQASDTGDLEESSILVEDDFGRTEGDADDPDDGWEEARIEA